MNELKRQKYWIAAIMLLVLINQSCFWTLPPIDLEDGNANLWQCGNVLVDQRDGQEYHTVWIDEDGGHDIDKPGQCWMAENLKYNMVGEVLSSCYDDLSSNCEDYGRLYQWNLITDFDLCPEGWHVPIDSEWKVLEARLGIRTSELDALRDAISVERGKLININNLLQNLRFHQDTYPYPGFVHHTFRDFRHKDELSYFWSATEYDATTAILRILQFDQEGIGRVYLSKRNEFCIRCIKDW